MKKVKTYLYLAAAIWVFLIFIRILLGKLSLTDLNWGSVMSRLVDPESIVLTLLLTGGVLFMSRLRHWPVWSLALVVLGVISSGIDLPQSLLVYTERQSLLGVLLTLFALLTFWFLEKLETKYTGSDNSTIGIRNSLNNPNEMIPLNLEDDEKKVPKHV